MATKYSDIIRLRPGRPAYNIEEEKSGDWAAFIPNEQFNSVLRTVIKSVRGNDIDNHKSFWINGTYGTGKSHAAAVIAHLLSDPVDEIQEWIDYEYKGPDYEVLKQSILKLRGEKQLLPVKIYGLRNMSHVSDLAVVLQNEIKTQLKARGIEIAVPTDLEAVIANIEANPSLWETLIADHDELNSIVSTPAKLIEKLRNADAALGTYHRINDTLRQVGLAATISLENIGKWLIEVQEHLRATTDFKGLLILWDEFTDVMAAFGAPILKAIQEIAEKFANEENDSYICLISHPSAFDKISSEEVKQTDGRYHRMKYNMEPVSAFKIMSRKFEVVLPLEYVERRQSFYRLNPDLLDVYTAAATNVETTREDLKALFPLHPGTANLATHYATVIGSSSRSVFEFLGQNDAIREFLDDEEQFLNRRTITADYLWDFVLSVFQNDTANYGAVTERFNSYKLMVEHEGPAYFAIFKGILLLNAFNNMSAENNQGLVTPSEDNIRNLFAGTQYADALDEVLNWFNDKGVIQRAPGGLFSVQFSALPSQEIEDKKRELRATNFRFTHQVVKFSGEARTSFERKFVPKLIRPYAFEFYSDEGNDSSLAAQIKNGKRNAKSYELFFALLFGRDVEEIARLREFAEKKCDPANGDNDLRDILFVVFDEPFTDKDYERFIEYQANYSCASAHGFVDQTATHAEHAKGMIKDFMNRVSRGNATVYVNGRPFPISVKRFSSELNDNIVPTVFSCAPEAYELLRKKSPSTFWRQQNSKEIVRKVIFSTTKTELAEVNAVMAPFKFIFQDAVDENLQWKPDVPDTHPLKAVFNFVDSKIKHADKSLPFNFIDKFIDLTKAPYGLYGSYAAMAIFAYAMRPHIGKIFDSVGKPRDAHNLVEDISDLFRAWDSGRPNSKLTFKFQTKEEGQLCKALIDVFHLNKLTGIGEISSLKDARFAITGLFLKEKGYPLWAVKYTPGDILSQTTQWSEVPDNIKTIIDGIITICSDRELKNPALVIDTLEGIKTNKFELRSLFMEKNNFTAGFNAFLMADERVKIQPNEIDEVMAYLHGHLESTIGYWSEDEVISATKDWRLEKQAPQVDPIIPVDPMPPVVPVTSVRTVAPDELEEKKRQATARIDRIGTVVGAKELLRKLIANTTSPWLLDQIINK